MMLFYYTWLSSEGMTYLLQVKFVHIFIRIETMCVTLSKLYSSAWIHLWYSAQKNSVIQHHHYIMLSHFIKKEAIRSNVIMVLLCGCWAAPVSPSLCRWWWTLRPSIVSYFQTEEIRGIIAVEGEKTTHLPHPPCQLCSLHNVIAVLYRWSVWILHSEPWETLRGAVTEVFLWLNAAFQLLKGSGSCFTATKAWQC